VLSFRRRHAASVKDRKPDALAEVGIHNSWFLENILEVQDGRTFTLMIVPRYDLRYRDEYLWPVPPLIWNPSIHQLIGHVVCLKSAITTVGIRTSMRLLPVYQTSLSLVTNFISACSFRKPCVLTSAVGQCKFHSEISGNEEVFPVSVSITCPKGEWHPKTLIEYSGHVRTYIYIDRNGHNFTEVPPRLFTSS
jgi:hypothetical protein